MFSDAFNNIYARGQQPQPLPDNGFWGFIGHFVACVQTQSARRLSLCGLGPKIAQKTKHNIGINLDWAENKIHSQSLHVNQYQTQKVVLETYSLMQNHGRGGGDLSQNFAIIRCLRNPEFGKICSFLYGVLGVFDPSKMKGQKRPDY